MQEINVLCVCVGGGITCKQTNMKTQIKCFEGKEQKLLHGCIMKEFDLNRDASLGN